VDTIQGGSGNDTITALQATTATFTIGDNIIGGAGTDTLNILNTTATASAVVSIDGVENINVRMLQADTQAFDATDWNGVAVLSNASSIADSTLSVSGLTIATTISVNDESNVTIEFADIATGAETATVILNSVGSGTTSTVTVVTGGTANVNLDATAADTLVAANLTVNGTNFLRLEAGDGVETVTLTGTGNVHLTTDDLIATLNASALTGTNRFTLSGDSDVSVVGGAGKDTFAFGTSLDSYDTIDGGADATDALTATINNSNINLNATNLELATFTLANTVGQVTLTSAQSITSLTVAGTADSLATFTNFAGGTANLSDGDVDVTIDTVAAGTLVVNVGSASGSLGFSAITVTDATTLTVNSLGSGAVTQTITALVATAAQTVNLNAAGSASLTVTEGTFSAASTVNLNAAGSATLTLADAIGGSALSTINITAQNSDAADVAFSSGGLFGNGSGGALARTVNIVASSGSDVTLIGVSAGSATYSASGTVATGTLNPTLVLNANAGNASIVNFGDILATGVSATLNFTAGQSGSVVVDDLITDNQTGTGVVSLNINAVVAQDGNVDIDLISGSGAPVNVAAVSVGASGSFTLGSGGILATGGKVTIGQIDVGVGASFTAGAIGAASAAAIVINVGQDGDAVVGAQGYTGGNNSTTTLTVASSGSATFGTIAASSIGAISVTLADNATGAMGNLGATGGGKIGNITATVGGSSLFAFGDIGSGGSAIASVGTITLTVGGSGGSADIGNIVATAASVGDIRITVAAGADADIGTVTASAIGSITVIGAGDVTIGAVGATWVGDINLLGQTTGAAFTINLSGVTNVVSIAAGVGTNTITSGLGDDEIKLKTGAGTDTLVYNASAQGTDTVTSFQTADVIRFGTGLNLTDGSGDPMGGSDMATAISFTTVTAAATAMDASDNVVVITGTAFASWSGVIDYIGDSKSAEVSFVAASAASLLAVVWGNTAGDTTVTLATVTAGVLVLTTGISSFSLVTLTGVTPGALVAANFDIAK
jgi:fibronectin-binding autotransporter adhesin